jgi:DUF1680 family protein
MISISTRVAGVLLLLACQLSLKADSPVVKVPNAVDPFPMPEVRLLDGPFKDAMTRDGEYLLSLDADRLLLNFRVNAGLPSSAKPYGGWEAPNCELRGHVVGHYLSACSLMYASTGDARFKDRVDKIVAGFAECQAALAKNGSNPGYLSAFPESFIDRVEQGKSVWAPWYTLHKIMAGLLDANQHAGNAQALEVLTNMANWVQFRVARLSHTQMQRMLNTEQGGMNEVLANLYAVTGNTNYLAVSEAFNHERVLGPLSEGQDQLNGLHANTQIPKVIGITREYELTDDPQDLTAARTFWDSVALRRSYVIGGDSDHEHFFSTNDFAHHLSPETCETCNTYNMLKLTRDLFELDPDVAKMDFYERALYNDILASQDPDTGMFVYLMSLKPGHFKVYSTPEDSFWCCVGTGMENHAKYGDTIYFHTGDSLFVNLFIASELTWPEQGLTLRQDTKFPTSDTSTLKMKLQKPTTLTLKIRHPAWATDGMTVRINGKKQDVESAPSSYLALTREWHDGDKIEVRLPMSLHTEFLPGVSNDLAVLYGPIVLAGELGTNSMPDPLTPNQTDYSRLPAPSAPMFVADADDLLKHIKPVSGEPLTFRTRGIGRPKDVTLIPFYELHRQRYSVYWQLISAADWTNIAPTFAAEEARRMADEARVVDFIRAGEQQSETDHKLDSQDSTTSDAYGYKWRQATGWFSYQVKVAPDQPQQLVVAVHAGDRGGEGYDVQVDGQQVSAQPSRPPTGGYNAVYELPAELVHGKQSVTVKFIAHPGKSVAGISGVRVLRENAAQ